MQQFYLFVYVNFILVLSIVLLGFTTHQNSLWALQSFSWQVLQYWRKNRCSFVETGTHTTDTPNLPGNVDGWYFLCTSPCFCTLLALWFSSYVNFHEKRLFWQGRFNIGCWWETEKVWFALFKEKLLLQKWNHLFTHTHRTSLNFKFSSFHSF